MAFSRMLSLSANGGDGRKNRVSRAVQRSRVSRWKGSYMAALTLIVRTRSANRDESSVDRKKPIKYWSSLIKNGSAMTPMMTTWVVGCPGVSVVVVVERSATTAVDLPRESVRTCADVSITEVCTMMVEGKSTDFPVTTPSGFLSNQVVTRTTKPTPVETPNEFLSTVLVASASPGRAIGAGESETKTTLGAAVISPVMSTFRAAVAAASPTASPAVFGLPPHIEVGWPDVCCAGRAAIGVSGAAAGSGALAAAAPWVYTMVACCRPQ